MFWFEGGGRLGELIRRHDWSAHPLGPLLRWPRALKSALHLCLTSQLPTVVYWGPELFSLYNDAYAAVLADKHPTALGAPMAEVWRELRGDVVSTVVRVRVTGEPMGFHDRQLFVHRSGYLEESYFTASRSPILQDDGQVGGVFCLVFDTTSRVLGDRRTRTLRDIAVRAASATGVDEACAMLTAGMRDAAADLPFACLYLGGRGKPGTYDLRATVRL
jgi:hypothetical protein